MFCKSYIVFCLHTVQWIVQRSYFTVWLKWCALVAEGVCKLQIPTAIRVSKHIADNGTWYNGTDNTFLHAGFWIVTNSVLTSIWGKVETWVFSWNICWSVDSSATQISTIAVRSNAGQRGLCCWLSENTNDKKKIHTKSKMTNTFVVELDVLLYLKILKNTKVPKSPCV